MSTVELAFDPFRQIIEAYEELYNKPCRVQFTYLKRGTWGFTEFFDDPSELPIVNISVKCSIERAMDVLTHELAHVEADTGCEDDHGPEWQKVFNALHTKYTEMVTSDIPEGMEVHLP